MNAQELEAEIDRRVEEATPELLPQLLERLLQRPGLVDCVRHGQKLIPYVRAQIALTRAKRRYFWDDDESSGYYPQGTPQGVVDHYRLTLRQRHDVRKDYRSTPCTSWVHHG